MKIKKIEITNFKRFTHLVINNIPNDNKLVLLIGSNGSGKSSVFDIFGCLNNVIKGEFASNEYFENYYKKDKNATFDINIDFSNNLNAHLTYPFNTRPILPHNIFYGRTSFRQIPRLTRKSLGQGGSIDIEKDSDRPRLFIEKDNRFENDIEKITEIILKDFFRSNRSNEQIREVYIDPINKSLKSIFGETQSTRLELIEIIPPLEGKVAQITFKKGLSEIHYNFLSAGEKEVFNILINLLTRKGNYQDSIYFIDEMDIHLNTKLQYNLIKEITENWIPDNCQLWIATHSLGFIEYAKQKQNAVIFDFDDFDFDIPKILSPIPKDNPEVYEIAVGKEFLPALFRQMDIYFVENNDKDYYASIGIPNTVFVSDNNRNNVFHKVRATQYKGIVDRDFLSDSDIEEISNTYPNLRILKYYCIENFMYHPDNLEEYYQTKNVDFNKANYITNLIDEKNIVKDSIIPSISLKRTEYPYFGEPEFNGNPLQNRFKNRQENIDQSTTISGYLNSNELEIFYKVLSMKSYCTNLNERQNIPKSDLVKTNWFKSSIESIIFQA